MKPSAKEIRIIRGEVKMPKDKNNDQFSIEDILNDNYDSTETFSLESILSEYKGSAFIQGEKKTPSHELDDKVNEILRSS